MKDKKQVSLVYGRVKFVLLYCFIIIFAFPAGATLAGGKALLLATTTSTDNTGLLDYLVPYFTKATGIDLRWVAVGTGKALKLGRNCDVDVLLVHAPSAEKRYVSSGYGVERRQVMYNDFVIIGPAFDPAAIRGKSATDALVAIKRSKAAFISRGDNSGTHKKETRLWADAGVEIPEKQSWYVQTGQGMLATINIAAERKGYTLTDRGTYIKYSAGKGGKPPLVVLVQGDDRLRNQYSVMLVNYQRCPNVKQKKARAFANWLTGQQAQKLIADFRLLGKQLFIPNAK